MQTNFWNYNEILSVHVELSSICNAACPGCQRFNFNSPIVRSDLIQQSVTLEQFKKWFPLEVVTQIKFWQFCGTFGDPMAAKEIYEILEYICNNSSHETNIQVNTNGGLRSTSLYKKIGKLFATHAKLCLGCKKITFSIDGLSDTNHIYRRNVVWEKVWNNLMTYIETGAEANWDFLQFKHNVHQVDKARAIAEKHNIMFCLKNPHGVDKVAMPVYNKNFELEYIIEHATDNGYPYSLPAGIGWQHATTPEVPPETEGVITCNSKREHGWIPDHEGVTEIYIDSQGQILPCCFVSVALGGTSPHIWSPQVQKIQSDMGLKNNLNHYSLKEIINSGVLEIWSNSWKTKGISICWQFCGKATGKERAIDILWI